MISRLGCILLSVMRAVRLKNSYGSITIKIRDRKFDGRKANRYRELLLKEQGSEIMNLELFPEFVLNDSHDSAHGRDMPGVKFLGDFGYDENGRQVVEKIKPSPGKKYRSYEMQKRLFLRRYPRISLKELARD